MLLTVVLVVLLSFVFVYASVAVVDGVFLPFLEVLGYGPYPGRVCFEPSPAALVVASGLSRGRGTAPESSWAGSGRAASTPTRTPISTGRRSGCRPSRTSNPRTSP
jgi:hypothetical protein